MRFSVGFGKEVFLFLPRSTRYLASSLEVWRGRFSRAQQGFSQPEFSRRTPSQRLLIGCPTEVPRRALPWLFASVVERAI